MVCYEGKDKWWPGRRLDLDTDHDLFGLFLSNILLLKSSNPLFPIPTVIEITKNFMDQKKPVQAPGNKICIPPRALLQIKATIPEMRCLGACRCAGDAGLNPEIIHTCHQNWLLYMFYRSNFHFHTADQIISLFLYGFF